MVNDADHQSSSSFVGHQSSLNIQPTIQLVDMAQFGHLTQLVMISACIVRPNFHVAMMYPICMALVNKFSKLATNTFGATTTDGRNGLTTNCWLLLSTVG